MHQKKSTKCIDIFKIKIKIYINTMGAGILPVAEYNETIYFLLGQEYFDKKWGDGSSRSRQYAV